MAEAMKQKQPFQGNKPNLAAHKDAAENSIAQNLNTKLLEAIKNGDNEEIINLLDAGANIEATDNSGRTPLMWAAWCGKTDACALLLKHNANIEATDENGKTPLIYAARSGRIRACIVLLKNNAKSDIKDKMFERTASMWAREAGNYETEAFLNTMELAQKFIPLSAFWDCILGGS
jgi:ankyrin repeat protein